MPYARHFVSAAAAIALIVGLTVAAVPAGAVTAGLVVDDFSSSSAAPHGSRTSSATAGNSFGVSGNTGTVKIVNGNTSTATVNYAFTSPQDMTASGLANELVFDFSSVTSTDPTAAEVINIGVVTTDNAAHTSNAMESVQTGQTVAVFPLSGTDGFDLHGAADLTHISAISFTFSAINNLGGATNTMAITRIATINPNEVLGQSITFTSTPPTSPAFGSTYTVAATGGGSGNPVTFSIDGSTTDSACSIAGATVTFNHAGSCVIDANQAGTPTQWGPAPQEQQQVTVPGLAQAITFTSTPPTSPAFGSSYTVSATGGASGNAVTFSVDGATTNAACSVSGSTVTFQHAGSCVIAANQAANSDHSAAPKVTQTVSVPKGTQAISFTSAVPPTDLVGGSYSGAATGGASGNAVTFSVAPATTNAACTVSGATVSFAHTGTCVIAANQAGNADYLAAAAVTQSIPVGQGVQAINFTSTPPATPTFGETYDVTATGGASGDPVTFSLDAATTNAACTVSGSTVTFQRAGDCVVDADQVGNADYRAAPTAVQSVSVPPAAQAITFTSTAPDAAAVGGATYDVTATGGASGNPVTFSVDAATTNAACTVSGSTVTFLHAGSCVVAADQASNADYTAATTATQTVTVAQGTQAIGFTSSVPSPAYVSTTYDVAATGGPSGNPVTFSSNTPALCTASGATITFVAAGTCVIAADQASNADYSAATTATQDVVVTRVPSTVAVRFDVAAPVFGQPVHATATVTPAIGSPAGNIQFDVDGSDLGLPVALGVDGTATSPALASPGDTALTPDAHDITATFLPVDAVTYAGAGGTGTTTAGKAETATTMQVHVASISATVAASAPGAGTPTGKVTFLVGGTAVGSAPLAGGTATLATRVPAGKSQTVAATYGGDEDFLASSGATVRSDPTIRVSVRGRHPKTRAGWFRGPVTITFTCSSHGAPLIARCPTAVVLRHNGAAQSISRTIVATNGGTATVSASPINIDSTAPAVSVTGVRNGAQYVNTGPRATCHATDALSGVATCAIARQTRGPRVTYTAKATDKAGNTRTARVTVTVATFAVTGAPFTGAAFTVRRGKTYTLVAVGASQPRYIDAAPFPERPSGNDALFHRAGSVGGVPRWTLGVTFTQNLGRNKFWNIGIKVGKTLHVLKIRVS